MRIFKALSTSFVGGITLWRTLFTIVRLTPVLFDHASWLPAPTTFALSKSTISLSVRKRISDLGVMMNYDNEIRELGTDMSCARSASRPVIDALDSRGYHCNGVVTDSPKNGFLKFFVVIFLGRDCGNPEYSSHSSFISQSLRLKGSGVWTFFCVCMPI